MAFLFFYLPEYYPPIFAISKKTASIAGIFRLDIYQGGCYFPYFKSLPTGSDMFQIKSYISLIYFSVTRKVAKEFSCGDKILIKSVSLR
jgi:hypothetical protein